MYTIGQLAKEFALSRSTLLYYDSLGLFSPSSRNEANYRLYTEEDRSRLEQICTFRRAGLSLKDIGKILETAGNGGGLDLLEKRLDDLNREIRALRNQQHFIVQLLKNDRALARIQLMDKESWVRLLELSGLDENVRNTWHVEFERLAPAAHQDFLESLGIPPEEVDRIRAASRKGRKD